MVEQEARKLFDALLHSDTEEAVIAHLKTAKLWDDPKVWRLYGDLENNYSGAGN